MVQQQLLLVESVSPGLLPSITFILVALDLLALLSLPSKSLPLPKGVFLLIYCIHIFLSYLHCNLCLFSFSIFHGRKIIMNMSTTASILAKRQWSSSSNDERPTKRQQGMVHLNIFCFMRRHWHSWCDDSILSCKLSLGTSVPSLYDYRGISLVIARLLLAFYIFYYNGRMEWTAFIDERRIQLSFNHSEHPTQKFSLQRVNLP